jgi:RNA polymerase sigma-70 factor (ECF subfamily)
MNKNQPVSNEELTIKIKASDSNAFDSLYLYYYERLFHFFWVRTKSEELAKDFIQDVFVRIWNNRKNLDPNKSINAYIYKTAQSVVINYYEKKSVRERARNKLLLIETTTEISDVFDLEENIAILIKKLPSEVQQIFLLSRMEELTYQEIAERLNISIKKVERLMSQALKILRIKYKKMIS